MSRKKLIILLSSIILISSNSYAYSSNIRDSNPKKQTLVTHYYAEKYTPKDSETSVVDEGYSKRFVFSESHKHNFFSDSLEKRLKENIELCLLTAELSYHKNNILDDTDPEIKRISDKIDNLAIQDVWESLWDTFKQKTDPGLWYRIFSRDVSSFLQTGFLKSVHEKKGKFYLPFQSDKGKLEKEIDIGASLSGFFYTDKFLEWHYSLKLSLVLGDDKADIVYDINKKKVEIGFTNDEVDSFLGENAEFKIYVDHNWREDVETRVGLQISFALNSN